MATNGTLVTVSLSTTVFSTSSAQPTSSEGYQTETSTLTLAVAVSPTSVLSDIATTTVDAGSDVYAAMFVAEAGRMNNKRAETTVNIALDQTAVSSKPEPPSAPRASSKPPSAPKSSKPKSSSKPSAGDEVKTITISQDPRCPYPYPGIHCGMPVTTVTTVRKATKTSEASEPKKTGSVEYCPYLYPGGKGDACL
ncbi:hypothetical protein BU23DRAFT_555916 [Bimuria novae-zelandiae CBS 107.79]|uniref:Uncharacterized protein n=1 Tax=Bimuria novae-zelandiae CBS 107.79 TaxID=1447943 RepID=A0A6A5V418_9PLEO|nr:hypothetical protein BU23DRAFT_555916 [Bimuria novae-zelandiae CBS 107.79]